MSLLGVLAVIFIVLKLVGVITVSWWWLFGPLLALVGLYLVVFTLFGAAFAAAVNSVVRRK